MTTFALIHGAWHGAWCWDPLIPELEQRGHRAVAIDLPCDDPAATIGGNAKLVADSVADAGDDDVVVVGHSLGGIEAAAIPLLRPVRKVVFLAALIPRPGRSMGDVLGSEPDTTTEEFDNLPRNVGDSGSVTWDPEIVGPFFYRACDESTARWAAARLRRQHWNTSREPCPLDRWPGCELASILCTEDELLQPSWSRRIAHDVLGVDPIELPGGHFPMLSIPTELAAALTA
jgi:pimeloyl-ACP methyl ester carboxylesterase